jgi:hypothetical protein
MDKHLPTANGATNQQILLGTANQMVGMDVVDVNQEGVVILAMEELKVKNQRGEVSLVTLSTLLTGIPQTTLRLPVAPVVPRLMVTVEIVQIKLPEPPQRKQTDRQVRSVLKSQFAQEREVIRTSSRCWIQDRQRAGLRKTASKNSGLPSTFAGVSRLRCLGSKTAAGQKSLTLSRRLN